MGGTCASILKDNEGNEIEYLQIGGIRFPAIKIGKTYNFVQPDFSGYKTPRTAFSARSEYHARPYYGNFHLFFFQKRNIYAESFTQWGKFL